MTTYRLAGRSLSVDMLIPELAPFIAESCGSSDQPPNGFSPVRSSSASRVFDGPGWLGNRWCQIGAWSGPGGYWLAGDEVGSLSVSLDGQAIALAKPVSGVSGLLLGDSLVGPAIALALALQGVWCLHASAAALDGHVVAFLGESGQGKSTLAAFLGTDSGPAWRRVCDDVLPTELADTGLLALPHFPQLKLPSQDQPSSDLPERMKLVAIYVLREPAAGQDEVEIRSLDRQQSALSLVRHTVAARLFGPDLLARHLAFCTDAAAQAAIYSLSYPRCLDLLPRVRYRLRESLLSTT